MQSPLIHDQFSRADRVPRTVTAPRQATGHEHATPPQFDSMTDLWRQLDRTTLKSSKRTPLSDANPSKLQVLDSQGFPDAVASSGRRVGHLRPERQATNRHHFTSADPIRLCTRSEDVICDDHLDCSSDSSARHINILHKPSTQGSLISSAAFSIGSGPTLSSTLTKKDEEELRQGLGVQQMKAFINHFPYRTTRDHVGRQNTVLKHIRQRKVRKNYLLKPRKSSNECIVT
jgi:hypothetical protein